LIWEKWKDIWWNRRRISDILVLACINYVACFLLPFKKLEICSNQNSVATFPVQRSISKWHFIYQQDLQINFCIDDINAIYSSVFKCANTPFCMYIRILGNYIRRGVSIQKIEGDGHV
jgi:hypothetical protein